MQPWQTIPREVALAMEDVFQRRSLESLLVGCIGALPIAMLEKCLGAASTLSLAATTVESTTSAPVLTLPPVLQNLFLIGSPGVADVLLSGQFDSQLANVRRLWWKPMEGDGERPISDVAAMIEHIRIEYEDYPPNPSHLVPALWLDDAGIAAYLDYTSSLPTLDPVSSVAAGKTLKEIILKSSPRGLPVKQLLAPIEELAIGCDDCARSRWRVDIAKHAQFTFTLLCSSWCSNPTKTASHISSSALSAQRGSTPRLY
ncbi:hypothetical protein DFH06DRAFT_655053 [Mycena polygramma]|nr:hypothetical protein DFH06DRAFT_655053 [Mycena polygramma]